MRFLGERRSSQSLDGGRYKLHEDKCDLLAHPLEGHPDFERRRAVLCFADAGVSRVAISRRNSCATCLCNFSYEANLLAVSDRLTSSSQTEASTESLVRNVGINILATWFRHAHMVQFAHERDFDLGISPFMSKPDRGRISMGSLQRESITLKQFISEIKRIYSIGSSNIHYFEITSGSALLAEFEPL